MATIPLTAIPLTAEQEAICDAVQAGLHIVVLACAGCGKTTALLHAVQRRSSPAIFFEYNRRLHMDAQKKADELGIQNCVVTNYDTILVRHYDSNAPHTGFHIAINEVLRCDTSPKVPLPDFELIVVDEAQDLADNYYRFLQKIIRDRSNHDVPVQIVLCGDERQTIYGFRGASSTYLTDPTRRYAGIPIGDMRLLRLQTTQRFGRGICNQVNKICRSLFGGWVDMIPCNESGGFTVWTTRRGRHPVHLAQVFAKSCLDHKRVAIVSFSINASNLALWKLIEYNNSVGGPALACAPTDDDEPHSPCLSTLHTTKGLDWDVVFFVLSNEKSWLSSVGKTHHHLKITMRNLMYVGLTRARSHLHVVQTSDEDILSVVVGGVRPLDAFDGLPVTAPADCPSSSTNGSRGKFAFCKAIDKLKPIHETELVLSINQQIAKTSKTPPGLSQLGTIAVRLKCFYDLRESISAPLLKVLEWCAPSDAPRTPPEELYSTAFSCTPSPRIVGILRDLCVTTRDWIFWNRLAKLDGPAYHHGHLVPHDDEAGVDALVSQSWVDEFTQLLSGLRRETIDTEHDMNMLYFSDSSAEILTVPILGFWGSTILSMPRNCDVISAAAALMKGSRFSKARLVYIGTGLSVTIELTAASRALLQRHFERV